MAATAQVTFVRLLISPVKIRLACALGQRGFRLVFPLRNQQPGTALLRLQCGTA